MALPFLDPKKMNQGVINRRAPKQSEPGSDSEMSKSDLEMAMSDFHTAHAAGSHSDMAKAFEAAHAICSSKEYPDESLEGEA